ncbi:MAG TPA: Holliday junction resolvase RuvX [Actinomycetota bacterium]|nr:Holliday junction resolvase RuvX [Actinomycetota bacterium]
MAESGRVLGLDLGDARIGVAISDPERRLAVPLGTVRTGAPEDVKAIAGLVGEHDITLVVVGHPLLLSGEAGERAHLAERFAEALGAFLGMQVLLQDERLSTAEADRALRATGASGKRRRASVDRSAATVILQTWLDAHRD